MNVDSALDLLERVYGRFGDDDACQPEDIAGAERRLGLALPRALAVLYLRTGRNPHLHRSHNRLVPLGDLIVRSNHLVFYQENQQVCEWGVVVSDLDADDPPVDTSYAGDAEVTLWDKEFASVTEFICVQGAWQAIHGGLPCVGLVSSTFRERTGQSAEARGRRVVEAANRIGPPYVTTKGTRAWIIGECVFAFAADDYFGLAGMTAHAFRRASAELGVDSADWDYTAGDDGHE